MDVRGYIEANAREYFDALKEWLAIPSISADPEHHDDVRRSAEWLVARLRSTGFPVAEVMETGGLPAVFAQWPAADPAAPTVLVYGHHDVQPVEPLEEWTSPPFQPAEVDGQILARGASDDKGQVLFHDLGLRACLAANGSAAPGSAAHDSAAHDSAAHDSAAQGNGAPGNGAPGNGAPGNGAPGNGAASDGSPGGAPPVTLKLLIEGEEESGSDHLVALLERERERLACDVIVVTDTSIWAPDVPSMCVGMRGVIGAQIDLRGADLDLHSGSFGGAVPNSLHVMAGLLAGLHDAEGRVTLPGFYDKVVPLSGQERELMSRLPFDEKEWLVTAGNSRTASGEAGYSTLERIWARPTAEVNGMWGGHTGAGGKTIIPSQAHAKVSFRLVADQDPADVMSALSEYVAAHTPPGIEATVVPETSGVRPAFSPIDSPAVAAGRRAMQRAFGREVLFTREGGSGPEADLTGILQAPLVFIGVGLDEDRIHAPNEKVDMNLLLKGAESVAYLWQELAAAAPEITSPQPR